MKGILFLIKSYLKPKKSIISLLTYLSVLGPLIGVCVLVVITSVMNGFPIALQKKIIEYESDISLVAKKQQPITNVNKIIKYLNVTGVKASPVTNLYSFIQKDKNIIPLKAKGILPKYDKKVSALSNYISSGNYNISAGECIIGESVAYRYDLNLNDKIILHSPLKYASLIKLNDNKQDSEKLVQTNQTLTLTIKGIFSYGYSTVDSSLIYIHLDDANDMTNIDWGQASEIETAIKNPFKSFDKQKQLLQDKFFSPYNLVTWQEKHRDYYETVQQEKALITFTLFFIMSGAAIGIAATLFSLIIQKTKEIGILKALGVSKKSLIFIFFLLGSFIGILGSVAGLALGLIVLHFRNDIFLFLWNSKTYFLREIPMLIVKAEVAQIVIVACLICILGSLIPAIIAAFIEPVSALKSDK